MSDTENSSFVCVSVCVCVRVRVCECVKELQYQTMSLVIGTS